MPTLGRIAQLNRPLNRFLDQPPAYAKVDANDGVPVLCPDGFITLGASWDRFPLPAAVEQ